MAEIVGRVAAEDAAAIKARIEQLIGDVCGNDPRSKSQRRADAFVAALLGRPALACQCGADDCAARSKEVLAQAQKLDGDILDVSNRRVIVHVVVNESTLAGEDDQPALLEGVGVVDADHARELANDTDAMLRPVRLPKVTGPASARRLVEWIAAPLTYRPGRALDEYVRIRDGYCVWPGCSHPARFADIDHTLEFNHSDPAAGGLTTHTNCKCLCRFHHLVKTFTAWRDRQTGNTTIEFTAPDGSTYPGPASSTVELFPDLEPPPPRQRPRVKDRAYRKRYERNNNHVETTAEQRRKDTELYEWITDDSPPPF